MGLRSKEKGKEMSSKKKEGEGGGGKDERGIEVEETE